MRNRIICGIQDRQLRENCLRFQTLVYKGTSAFCRAAELSKTRTKTLEEHKALDSLKEQTKRGNVSVNKRHDNSANERRENHDRDAKDSVHKEVLRYKLCSGKHRAAKKSCPSWLKPSTTDSKHLKPCTSNWKHLKTIQGDYLHEVWGTPPRWGHLPIHIISYSILIVFTW